VKLGFVGAADRRSFCSGENAGRPSDSIQRRAAVGPRSSPERAKGRRAAPGRFGGLVVGCQAWARAERIGPCAQVCAGQYKAWFARTVKKGISFIFFQKLYMMFMSSFHLYSI
jgi:hypothetical protein